MAHWLIVSLVSVLIYSVVISHKRPKSTLSGDWIDYESNGWFRESFQWDPIERRFLLSAMEGGIAEVRVFDNTTKLVEKKLVTDMDCGGNSTLGLTLDVQRHRVLTTIADVVGKKYSALAAYDTRTWQRLFLTKLAGPEELSLAEDVTVDPNGTAYVTDAKGNAIWKVSEDGRATLLTNDSLLQSQPNKLPLKIMGLTGIQYHPDGYLLVVHSWSGTLFKVNLDNSVVTVIKTSQPLVLAAGMVLISKDRLVVAGIPGARLVRTDDSWQTATVTHQYVGLLHRFPTAATVKDGKVYVNHLLGIGFKVRSFSIREATFTVCTRCAVAAK
eukprot:c29444_g1_i1 orf=841-1824(+)